MNLLTDPDLTYMIGKIEDMEYHVKDKFSEEVLLCGSFGDMVALLSFKAVGLCGIEPSKSWILVEGEQEVFKLPTRVEN